MFEWISGIFGKLAIGLSSLLIAAAGAISPAQKTDLAPVATSTSEIRVTGTTTKTTSSFVPILSVAKNNPTNSEKTLASKSAPSVSATPAQTTPKPTASNIAPQDENFSSVTSSALLSQSKFYQDLVDFADGAIEYIDIGLDELTTLIAKHEGYVLGLGSQNSDISKAFIEEYKSDISKTNVYRNSLVNNRDSALKNVSFYKKAALEDAGKFVTMQEMVATLESLQKDTLWSKHKDYISKAYEGYRTYRKDRDNYYVKIDAQLRALYTQMGSVSTVPTYQPQPVPQIQLPVYTPPQTTNCTISGDGGVGLQAYVNCTTY